MINKNKYIGVFLTYLLSKLTLKYKRILFIGSLAPVLVNDNKLVEYVHKLNTTLWITNNFKAMMLHTYLTIFFWDEVCVNALKDGDICMVISNIPRELIYASKDLIEYDLLTLISESRC